MASFQKKLAAKILKVGRSKVWLDPANMKEIKSAITRIDVKKLIKKKYIKVLPEKIPMPKGIGRKKRTEGKRKGKKFSVVTEKRRWISTVRPLRKMLKELKIKNEIGNETYKKMRALVKGGMFRSRSHLRIYLEQHGFLKKKG